MTVWCFGDSFAQQDYTSGTWMTQVADALDQQLNSKGLDGTSLDYTYSEFQKIRSNISHDDFIIIALTDLNRRWFNRNKPDDTIWNIMARRQKESEAIEYYLRYLDNKDPYNAYIFNFLVSLNMLSEKTQCTTVLLPCFYSVNEFLNHAKNYHDFDNLIIAKGNLYDISMMEFEKKFIDGYGIHRYAQHDLRKHHLVRSNHNILADKILKRIKYKMPIDLTRDFASGLINEHSLRDVVFSEKELFDIHLNEFKWKVHQFA